MFFYLLQTRILKALFYILLLQKKVIKRHSEFSPEKSKSDKENKWKKINCKKMHFLLSESLNIFSI